jgi:hypothetical protein
MNGRLSKKLAMLRADYQSVADRPFSHFFCPILRRDELSELCEGHVINAAFGQSDRKRIVQRSDVDNFFGRYFEGDFVLLQEKGSHDSVDILLDRDLSRHLHPQLSINGQPVQHYLPTGPVPKTHSELVIDRGSEPQVRLAIKLQPSDMLTALSGHWELVVDKDIRLHALVSLLKTAHLTLFSILGYSYAFAASGYFLGWNVLGSFVADNLRNDKSTVIANARTHFPEFANLVRPLLTPPNGMDGTITDRQLFLCSGTPKAWALMVLIRTGQHMHAVIVPLLEEPEGAARFAAFLTNPPPRFAIQRARVHNDHWEVEKSFRMVEWPEARFS